jgi:hypothetical protein
MADAVIAEFAKPTDAMIDAAYEAVRFDEAWAINSRRDFVKAVKAMVRSAPASTSPHNTARARSTSPQLLRWQISSVD